jgi:DNA-binding NarL/FixJ family response regulator
MPLQANAARFQDPPQGDALTVYLVEDSAEVRERLKCLLDRMRGIRVTGCAARADVAIADILAQRPDVSILDISLAQGTGFDVLRALHRSAPEIAVYMLSNFAMPEYRLHSAQLGALDVFDKSFEIETLCAALADRAAAREPRP